MRATEKDMKPRYAPETVLTMKNGKGVYSSVLKHVFYPPSTHPHTPICNDFGCLELTTKYGVRYFGCEKGWINSELKMVIQGTNPRDEVRMGWPICEKA